MKSRPTPDDPRGSVPPLPYELGPYRLESSIGRGGMGIVFEAYDRRLDRRVAVKRLLFGPDDPARRQRLRREARTTAQLAHPAVVQVFDLVEDDDGDWIVMERIHGTPLHRLLKQGPLDVDSVLHFGRQIAEGLAAAHALGIVHRDLKTENVMVLPDRRIKILDFGIAKQVGFAGGDGDLSKTGEVVGTSRAMSPEQARGLGVGPRSDLFSFGVLLYEALSGVSPFRAGTPLDTLARVVSHDPQPLDERVPGLPADLVDLLDRLLSKAPELRPAGASEVARTFEHLIDGRRQGAQAGDATEPATVAATVAATAFFDPDSTADRLEEPSQSSESAFNVRPLPRRPLIAVAVSAALAAALWVVWDRGDADHQPDVASAGRGPDGMARQGPPDTPGDAGDPTHLYDKTMQSLRRLDSADAPDRAIKVFQRMLEQQPDSATALAGLARAYWEKGRNTSGGGDPVHIRQGLAAAREAVRINPYLADAHTSLGLLLYAEGHVDDAAQHLETARELDPTQADAYYGLAKLAQAGGRVDEAVRLYGQAGELQPIPLYFNAVGALLYDHGRYEEAATAFRRSLELSPEDLHALRNLGAVYYALGRLDDASAMLQSALRLRPDASLYSNLGTIFYSRGLYAKAAAAFEDALLLKGAAHHYIYWLNLADAYRRLPERAVEAERSYHRALQMLDDLVTKKPGDVRLRSRRALALARSGRPSDAAADLTVLTNAGTAGDLYSLFRMGVTLEVLGRRQEALQTLDEALRAGFSVSEIQQEPDLTELRRDPNYHLLLVGLDRMATAPARAP